MHFSDAKEDVHRELLSKVDLWNVSIMEEQERQRRIEDDEATKQQVCSAGSPMHKCMHTHNSISQNSLGGRAGQV